MNMNIDGYTKQIEDQLKKHFEEKYTYADDTGPLFYVGPTIFNGDCMWKPVYEPAEERLTVTKMGGSENASIEFSCHTFLKVTTMIVHMAESKKHKQMPVYLALDKEYHDILAETTRK